MPDTILGRAYRFLWWGKVEQYRREEMLSGKVGKPAHVRLVDFWKE